MIDLILGIILLVVGLFCALKPNNPLLSRLHFGKGYVTKPDATQYIKKYGKTKPLLLWMRIFGIVMAIVGIVFILSFLKII